MDPADPDNFNKQVLFTQGVLMGQQQHILLDVMDSLHGLSCKVNQLSAQLNQS